MFIKVNYITKPKDLKIFEHIFKKRQIKNYNILNLDFSRILQKIISAFLPNPSCPIKILLMQNYVMHFLYLPLSRQRSICRMTVNIKNLDFVLSIGILIDRKRVLSTMELAAFRETYRLGFFHPQFKLNMYL